MEQNKTRSYVMQVPDGGTYQRNGRHLLPMPDESMDKRDDDVMSHRSLLYSSRAK